MLALSDMHVCTGSGQYAAAAAAAAASRVAIVEDRGSRPVNPYTGVFGNMTEVGELPSLKPADADAARFELHPSVAFWHDYAPEVADDEAPLNEQLSWLARVRMQHQRRVTAAAVDPEQSAAVRAVAVHSLQPLSQTLGSKSLAAKVIFSGAVSHL